MIIVNLFKQYELFVIGVINIFYLNIIVLSLKKIYIKHLYQFILHISDEIKKKHSFDFNSLDKKTRNIFFIQER